MKPQRFNCRINALFERLEHSLQRLGVTLL